MTRIITFILIFLFCQLSLASTDPFTNAMPHFVKIPQGKMEYYSFGKGQPIVLINGYGSVVTGWDVRLLKSLAADHRVIIFNNRNTGHSIIHSKSYTISDLANDTYYLIKNLHLKKPTVIGISMGGMIAQELAVLHPDVITRLILINTAIAGTKAIPPSENIKHALFKTNQNTLAVYVKIVRDFFPFSWQMRMAVSILEYHFQPYQHEENDIPLPILLKQQALIYAWGKDNATANKLAQLKLPVLIMNGGSDIIVPPINSDILVKTIPHAHLVRWQEGGHGMTFQFPQQIAATINRFTS